MGKVILKTALITVASILVAFGIFYLGMMAFAPSALADFYEDAGNEKIALNYREKAYKKDNSQDNLKKIIYYSIECKNDEKVIVYSKIFVDRVIKNEFSVEKDEFDYITNAYCIAVLKVESPESAITLALSFLNGDYPKHNQIESLIVYGAEKNDITLIEAIHNRLLTYKGEVSETISPQGKVDLDDCIKKLETLLS